MFSPVNYFISKNPVLSKGMIAMPKVFSLQLEYITIAERTQNVYSVIKCIRN